MRIAEEMEQFCRERTYNEVNGAGLLGRVNTKNALGHFGLIATQLLNDEQVELCFFGSRVEKESFSKDVFAFMIWARKRMFGSNDFQTIKYTDVSSVTKSEFRQGLIRSAVIYLQALSIKVEFRFSVNTDKVDSIIQAINQVMADFRNRMNPQTNNNVAPITSIPEEIMKYKMLFDSGAIDFNEFEKRNKNCLENS